MSKKRKKLVLFKGDRSLWIIIGVLCVVSLLVVYSSTASMAYREVKGDTSYYVLRQLRFLVGGFFMIIVVHWIDYRFFLRYAKIAFRVSILLVGLAYFIGVNFNDASRWIRVPFIGLTFQPSDMLKIALVMVLAVALGKRQGIINRIPILPALTYGAWKRQPQKNLDVFLKTTNSIIMPIFWAAVVVMPANLSTAVIIVLVALVMLWVGRVRPSQLGKLIWVAFICLVLIVGGMKLLGVGRADVWISRVESFVLPLTGAETEVDGKRATDEFQKEQAKIAIASGGAVGKGPGNSTQRSQLPHPYSDFAYAFIIEEYGALGGAVIFLLYLWIFYRCGIIVRRCTRPAGALLVLGLSLTITFQAFINMMVSVGLAPVTGQTLPLISLGGSSVLFTCISLGMILSVSRETDAELALAAETEAAEAQNRQLETQQGEEYSENQSGARYENQYQDTTPPQNEDSQEGVTDQMDEDPFIVVENPYEAQNNTHQENIDLYEDNR